MKGFFIMEKQEWKANPKEQYYNGSKNTFEINHGNDGECVAEVVHGFENALLMAASPELLRLCKLVYNSFGGGNIITFSEKDINDFDLAIRKAEGK